MNELISQDQPEFKGLIDLGSCTIHTVHNAFGKGMQQFGKEIDQLCMDLHSLFKYSPARCEDFKELQKELDLEVHNFIQHTEVHWLGMGPAINRILEQWEAVCSFVTELAKDPKTAPKSVNYKRVYMLLGTKEKSVTRVMLKFLCNVIPLFEQFLLLHQKSSPVVHMLYDSMCDILAKLMRRFLKPQVLEKKYGVDLAGIECRDLKLQLADRDIVIGDNTRKALKELSPDQQRNVVLGICSFFSTAVSYLQEKLPLGNQLLRQLGCMNPAKRKKQSTVLPIQHLATTLQPNLNETDIVDEWKAFQLDDDLPAYDPKERIEFFWNRVFDLQGPDGNNRYKVMPVVVKSALVLAQINADSEQSFS